ncbi:MAG: hypothetical protein R6X06_03365 [Gammaproteobacteria bacterium]
MSKKQTLKPIAAVMGTAFAASMAMSNVASADTNPFAMNELSSGYMQVADKHMEGKCGEGKCGSKQQKKDMEGKCGEGKCGGQKEMNKNMEGKCGGKKAAQEGKCGEGKCGAKK